MGHTVNKIDELWQQVSPRGIFRTGRNLACLIWPCYIALPRFVKFGTGCPLGRQNTEGCKNFVTLFSYIVWSSTMKSGMVRGLANWHFFLNFVNFDPGSRDTVQCNHLCQSFTDAICCSVLYFISTCEILDAVFVKLKMSFQAPGSPSLYTLNTAAKMLGLIHSVRSAKTAIRRKLLARTSVRPYVCSRLSKTIIVTSA